MWLLTGMQIYQLFEGQWVLQARRGFVPAQAIGCDEDQSRCMGGTGTVMISADNGDLKDLTAHIWLS